MLTLKKVKELVNAPVHTKRVPSPKVLLEEGRIFLRKEFEHGSHLTLYHNGYVWFSAGKRNTVFHIHDCRGDYAYGASKGKGEVIKEEYFENCEWHIRALFEGEQRVEESQLKCEGVGQTKVSVSYHAVAEDWGEMADSEINVLDGAEESKKVCYYICKARQADDKCIGHQIPEKLLKALIMDQLHLFIVQLSDKRKVLEELQKIEDVQNPVYRAKGEIMSLTDKVSQMAKKREQLYADYVAGVVDSEDYQLIREDYSRQYDGLRAALQEAENKKAEVERQIEEYLNMTSHLEEHLDNFEFDIQLVKSLVQKIEVSADKRIRIVFGFQDVFTELGKESAET